MKVLPAVREQVECLHDLYYLLTIISMHPFHPSFEARQAARLRRGDMVRRLMRRDKTPVAILFMAAIVGTLAGLAGVAFYMSVLLLIQ